ncbi:MAG: nitrile hydratase subunit beta, partial [Proteobacteria bacterium]|nr:nitrile hydratase subunit beta [Pseudomonadota bacterium]
MDQDLKMGPHDVGGEFSDPIDTSDGGMTHWEKFSNGVRIAVSARKVITLDELRLSAESFGDEYFKMPYFER